MLEDDAEAPIARRPVQIAIVDDDPSVRNAMRSLVQSLGYSAESFDGPRALLASDVRGFRLVISDLQMPGMSGMELLSALQLLTPGVPFIMMTAYPAEHVRLQASALGARAFLEKPCDIDALVSLIEGVIGPPVKHS